MVDASDFDVIRVVDRPTAMALLNLSSKSWERLERKGEAPPKTRLSERRIGYRVADLKAWLDARRATAAA